MQKNYDVAIIGGGITGCGIVRDCAMRGLKTVLLEKKDFSAGTTGACMGMIHGGMRYLTYDINTTKISCIDSGYIQKIAPFLLFRIPFIIPVLKGAKFNIELVETFLEAYDKFVHYKKGKKHTRLTKKEALEIEPGLSRDITGAVTTDEWGINPFRLSVLNAVSAKEYGADILNHTEIIEIIRDKEKIISLKVRNNLTGEIEDIYSKIFVNAAGPWVPEICKMAKVEVKLRPTKGINILFDRRITNFAVVSETIDGREILLMPHENSSMLGCTDDDYYGDLNYLTATEDEIEYLLQGMEKVFPRIREARIMRVMAGVRPTLFEWGEIEDKLSRDYAVYDHRKDSLHNFITIAGGKLAAYRMMAEDVTDLVCKKLNVFEKCKTHIIPLPGGEREIDIKKISEEYDIPLYIIKRIYSRHGCRTEEIMHMLKENPEYRNIICICEPVVEAEIRYCIRREWAITIDDIRRRARLGTGPCQGANCIYKVAGILSEEFNLSIKDVYREILKFLQERWKGKRPILSADQLVQEELNQNLYFNLGSFEEIEKIIKRV